MSRKPFQTSSDMRAKVRRLAALGLPQDDIAALAGCSPKTLRKHFRDVLNGGSAEANAAVAAFLFQAAKSGNVAAQIFWLKTRGKWPQHSSSADPAGAEKPGDPKSDQRILERFLARRSREKKGDEDA